MYFQDLSMARLGSCKEVLPPPSFFTQLRHCWTRCIKYFILGINVHIKRTKTTSRINHLSLHLKINCFVYDLYLYAYLIKKLVAKSNGARLINWPSFVAFFSWHLIGSDNIYWQVCRTQTTEEISYHNA